MQQYMKEMKTHRRYFIVRQEARILSFSMKRCSGRMKTVKTVSMFTRAGSGDICMDEIATEAHTRWHLMAVRDEIWKTSHFLKKMNVVNKIPTVCEPRDPSVRPCAGRYQQSPRLEQSCPPSVATGFASCTQEKQSSSSRKTLPTSPQTALPTSSSRRPGSPRCARRS